MSKNHFSIELKTYTSSRKVFHDGCPKRRIFSHQILNKNSVCFAHSALNRSCTVIESSFWITDNRVFLEEKAVPSVPNEWAICGEGRPSSSWRGVEAVLGMY